MMEQFTLEAPHPDIELDLPRAPINYFVTLPQKGVRKNTGLVLFIPGFGMLANSDYVLNKLSPYIADKCNCLVVSVNYFGIHNRPETGASYRLADDFFIRLKEIYNLEASTQIPNLPLIPENLPQLQSFTYNVLLELSRVLPVKWLDRKCQVLLRYGKGEYDSFGLLPAIDCLQVLGEVIKKYTLDTRKLIVLGSSYGGYLANLMGKFAPHTFSTIIDNSGFIKASVRHILGQELLLNTGLFGSFGSMNCYFSQDSLWTLSNEYSPYYFSDNHRAIRSLLHESHFQKTTTQYHIFHSIQDDITAAIQEKDQQVMLLKKYTDVFYHRIEPQHLDGKIFKTMAHGMNASLRGLFDISTKESPRKFIKPEQDNDFTLNQVHQFDCAGRSYNFHFKDDYSLAVEIT